MRKSKSIIIKSCWLITFSIICIFLLEANSLSNLRRFFATYIVFFQGKRVLFSNISIGILGSAVLTLFCEIIEYQSLKTEQQAKIVNISRKWERNIQHNLPIIFETEQDAALFLDRILDYWDEISSIYTEYVPFFRGGIYIKLIRSLYEFVHTIKKFFDKKDDLQNCISDFKKMQELIAQNKYKMASETIESIFEDYLKDIKRIEESDSDTDDAAIFLKEINRKKEDLNSVLIYANVLYLCGMESDVRQEDFHNDLRKVQYLRIKAHQKENGMRFRKFLHIIRHPVSTIHIKYLLYKYSNKP